MDHHPLVVLSRCRLAMPLRSAVLCLFARETRWLVSEVNFVQLVAPLRVAVAALCTLRLAAVALELRAATFRCVLVLLRILVRAMLQLKQAPATQAMAVQSLLSLVSASPVVTLLLPPLEVLT